MKVFNVRNVQVALIHGMDALRSPVNYHLQKSRNGNTLEFNTPITTVYTRPMERVLFWEERDANPFFHFFEGLWMLGGRDDVDSINWFNGNMKQYSDDGVTFNGAYGRRWRSYFRKDQLSIIIKRLKADKEDRRCVLGMWDPIKDLISLEKDNSVDIPCNTHVYFKIREAKLNMTVCCRSNDMIWGAYGANAVHFSMLQEYMAAKIGVPVGTYTHVSDSLHVYEDVFEKLHKKMLDIDPFGWPINNPYDSEIVAPYPMFVDADIPMWNSDLQQFLTYTEQLQKRADKWDEVELLYINPFFTNVAVPIIEAWHLHKTKKRTEDAIWYLEQNCQATDWALAGVEWLQRRIK